ncbi:hypothetical protein FLA_3517 [Filimonas lacunae]|nr:hypothetical protein FLA_3517 [Filimonas lacunae]
MDFVIIFLPAACSGKKASFRRDGAYQHMGSFEKAFLVLSG